MLCRDAAESDGFLDALRATASILLVAALALGACSDPGGPALVVETRSGTARIPVEIADTDAARERGLMGRTSLDADAGMLFIWPDDTSSTFWMKDTPLPLSVAFISASGEVLRTLDMEPCEADPCPVYEPRTTYRMALEVRQGTLERRGLRVGDRARLVR